MEYSWYKVIKCIDTSAIDNILLYLKSILRKWNSLKETNMICDKTICDFLLSLLSFCHRPHRHHHNYGCFILCWNSNLTLFFGIAKKVWYSGLTKKIDRYSWKAGSLLQWKKDFSFSHQLNTKSRQVAISFGYNDVELKNRRKRGIQWTCSEFINSLRYKAKQVRRFFIQKAAWGLCRSL